MPFPATIDNYLGIGHGNVPGPYQDPINNKIYALLVDGEANTGDLQSYVSTDSGLTWAIADSANHPVITTIGGFAGLSFGASYDPSARLINIIYSNPSPGFSFITFDTAVATWGTPINSGSGTQYLGTQTGGSTNGDVWGGNQGIFVAPLGSGTYITVYTAQAHYLALDAFTYLLSFVFNGTSFTSPVITYSDTVLDNSLSTATSEFPTCLIPVNGSQAVLISNPRVSSNGTLFSDYELHSWLIDGTTSNLGGFTTVITSSTNNSDAVDVGFAQGGSVYFPHADDTNLGWYSSPVSGLSWTQTILAPAVNPNGNSFSYETNTTSYVITGFTSYIRLFTNTGSGWSSPIYVYNSPDRIIFQVSANIINGDDAIVFEDVALDITDLKTKYFTGTITSPIGGLVLGPLNLTY
jgi:hypothetical protein